MQQTSSVSVIVVSYQNNAELFRFLDHVNAVAGLELNSLVAVANGLDKNAQRELQHADLSFGVARKPTIFAGTKNLGYFGGAKVGFEHLLATSSLPEWLIICNDDVRFDTSFFELLHKKPADHELGVVAPDIIVKANGCHQNPLYCDRPSKIRLQFLLLVHSARWLMVGYLFLRRFRVRSRVRQRSSVTFPVTTRRHIYAPHGSCIIFHRNFFERGCSLNYPSFLYCEELFVAETSARQKLKIEFDPTLRVIHDEHTTTSRLPSSKMTSYMQDSLAFVLREYF